MDGTRANWWGSFQLDVEQTSRWEVGSLILSVSRREQEWEIAWRSAPNNNGDEDRWRVRHT